MKVLVACEESQEVCKAFRALGHEAYSCDIEPCSGGHPEWHLQCDALELLKMQWDMILAFPPCTDLAVSGARYFAEKRADGRQQKSIEFFMQFATADCPKIAIENPVGIMSTAWRKPDQIIQPWQYGHGETKATFMAERAAETGANKYCKRQRAACMANAAVQRPRQIAQQNISRNCAGYGRTVGRYMSAGGKGALLWLT